MRALVCKPTVRVVAFTPALVHILSALLEVCKDPDPSWPTELVITSINDSKHMVGSRHYTNEALDLRSHNVPLGQRRPFLAYLQGKMGPEFTVILEQEGGTNEHYHIQPRKGTQYFG